MNFNSNIDRLFAFLIYFSTLTIYVKSEDNRALIFDRYTGAPIDINDGRKTIQHDLAVACPAESISENNFNSEHSFGKNSLFVREKYKATAPLSSVSQNICAEVYKLSVIYNRHNEEFELGYEVYYNWRKYYWSIFNNCSHANYDTVANAYSTNLKKPSTKSKFFGHSKPKLEEKNDDGKIKKKKLGFVWISVIRLKFDNLRKTPTEVIYILSKPKEISAQCADYSLGEEIYKQDIDIFYNHQINIFNNVEIPEADRGCETENNCLTKYSLVPAEELHFRSPEPKSISCSNLTTVPIWKRAIHGALQKLDTFLYALAKTVPGTLTVSSGVYGQLEMKNLHQETTKIFLGEENETPVPKIVYKIVNYNFRGRGYVVDYDFFDDPEEIPIAIIYKLASVIVFHNDPQFDVKDALCGANNCETLGWGEILKEATSSSESPVNNIRVYCCPANGEIFNKLGIKNNSAFREDLNLKTFPIFDKPANEKRITDIQKDVMNRMKDFLKERSAQEEVAQNEKV